jgi:hypothetical protein
MSLMLWPVGQKASPTPDSEKLRLKVRACRSRYNAAIDIFNPLTGNCGPSRAVLCARPLDNVSHARRDAHNFAFATLVSRIRSRSALGMFPSSSKFA